MSKTIKQETDENLFLLDDDDLDTQNNKYLLFHLGKEEYGIDIARVTAIEELPKITNIPDMPEYVKGVINLRGKVIPAVDLRLRFGLMEREYDNRTCIIIVRVEENTLGFIVDTVSEVHDIQDSNIEPPPSFKNASGHNQYIAGLAKQGEEVKIILDVEKIISGKDQNVLKKI
ncbi:MAG: purine-binding chemotaxis protein CheW [Spirochaetales bacterium]|nr:purine-binding chemotaxis protein CheW [Spirochaetales bacterium]